jgi:hypothetical protein
MLCAAVIDCEIARIDRQRADALEARRADAGVRPYGLPRLRSAQRQLTLGVTLIGHGAYRGVVGLMRDLLGVRISEGTVHNVHQAAA